MGRASGGFGPSHLGWVDLDAWCRLTGNVLEPWEVSVLMGLDTLWIIAQAKSSTPST